MTDRDRLLCMEQNGFDELLARHGGSMPHAAHELASLRLRLSVRASDVPNASEVHVAYREIMARTHGPGALNPTPTRHGLASICRSCGLLVIGGGD